MMKVQTIRFITIWGLIKLTGNVCSEICHTVVVERHIKFRFKMI